MSETLWVSENPKRPRLTRRRKWLAALAVAIAVVLVGGGLLAYPNPGGPPTTLHIWGKDFNSTGQVCEYGILDCIGYPDPPAASPMTMQAVQAAETDPARPPYVVHLLPGVAGWLLGITDAGNRPAQRVDVYLQVGSDAYIPYVWAHCCMPAW